MPNVQKLPGVPMLASYTTPSSAVSNVASVANTVIGDVLSAGSLIFGTTKPVYGLFDDDGNLVIEGQSTIRLEFSADYKISDYPTENGGFASYNKVALPKSAKLSYIAGTGADTTEFLTQLDSVVSSANTYTLVMPEYQYANVNPTHYDFSRDDRKGYSMLTVDVWVEEVRQTQARYSTANQPGNTQSPQGAAPQPSANVQAGSPNTLPTSPSASQQGAYNYSATTGEYWTPQP